MADLDTHSTHCFVHIVWWHPLWQDKSFMILLGIWILVTLTHPQNSFAQLQPKLRSKSSKIIENTCEISLKSAKKLDRNCLINLSIKQTKQKKGGANIHLSFYHMHYNTVGNIVTYNTTAAVKVLI